MKKIRIGLSMFIASLLLSGCVVPFAIDPSTISAKPTKEYEAYLKLLATREPVVVYRLDAQRFVTLETYETCDRGVLYYNDTANGIHKQVGGAGGASYQGKIINADPSGQNLVIPSVIAYMCEKCLSTLPYSTDAGRTFKFYRYGTTHNDYKEVSKKYTIAATKDQFFIEEARQRAKGVAPDLYTDALSLPSVNWRSSRLNIPHDLSPPQSGEYRYICDDKNLPPMPVAK